MIYAYQVLWLEICQDLQSFCFHETIEWAILHSDSNVCFKLSIVFAILLKLLSSAKLWTDIIKINNKKLLKNRLNKVGPTVKPLGTPDIKFLRYFFVIYTHALLSII